MVVSINAAIPGSALYLNTTRAEDLDGDGVARFDEAGTGFREITVLPAGVASASSPQVVGGDPSRDSRYPDGLKPQLNASFTLIPGSGVAPLSHQLLQAGWRSSGAGALSFEAWAYVLQASVDGANRVTDVTLTPVWSNRVGALPLKLLIPESPLWRNDVSLTPVWSDQDGNGSPDLLLGNWLWLDPLLASGNDAYPLAPQQLLEVTSGLSTAQGDSSVLQPEWTSLVLESGRWPLSGDDPLWAFGQNSRGGNSDSFGRIGVPAGNSSLSDGSTREGYLQGAITPERFNDLLDLRIGDLAAASGFIHATGSINRLQSLEEGGFAHQRSSAFG